MANILNQLGQGVGNFVGQIGSGVQHVEQGIGNDFHGFMNSLPQVHMQAMQQAVGQIGQNLGNYIQQTPQRVQQTLQTTPLISPNLSQGLNQFTSNLGQQHIQLPLMPANTQLPFTYSQAAHAVGYTPNSAIGALAHGQFNQIVPQIQSAVHDNAQVTKAMSGGNLDFTKPIQPQLDARTPQQQQQQQNLVRQGISNVTMGMLNPGKAEDLQKAAFYLRSKLTPESANILKDFATAVETKGANANHGQLANDAAHIMSDAFGKDANYWSNQKMKNTIDLVLGKIGGMKNYAGLGLSTQNIREGSSEASSINPVNSEMPAITPKTIEQPQLQQSSQLLNPNQKMASSQTIPNQVNSSNGSIPPQTSTQQYLNELIDKQNAARKGESLKLKDKIGAFYGKLKEQLIDSNAPIEDVLNSAEKQGKFNVLPTKDVRLQIDRALRSSTLAGQFAKDNGLVDVVRQAPDLQALDQYMIAKQASTVAKNGIETGRNLGKDAQLVTELAPIYEPYAQKVNQYSQKILDYSVDSGLISKETATMLKQKYPEYVPLNRIFNEDEISTQGFKGTGKGVASLSKQSVVQKLGGSKREIENPVASLLTKTQTAFDQGERNIAARQLASYKDLPDNPFQITPVKEGEANGKTTFSALINGEKQIFQTTPEIAAAAKSLNKEQMGLLAKIVSIPTRVLRLGATGLNYPFAFANLIKDQSSSFINSKNALATQNPIAFTKGLFAAVGHGKLYDDVVRSAAGGTSFDIGRENPNLSISKIRNGRNALGRVVNVVKDPIRTAEDLIGRTEELTRAQQYHGAYDALIKQGRTPQDAALLAAKQARENTVNFARGGTFSKVLNWVIPYFNAGVQGSRTFVRNVQDRPVQTLTKFALGVGMPVAAATAWNLSDPQRKAAYDDIPDFEKQNSIVIIPPNPTKNADGTWNVLKIPLSQEVAALSSLVRRPMEQAHGENPVAFGEVANALLQTGTSLNTQSPTGLISSLTPQLAKPGVEVATNTNLFTGQKIIPDYLKNLPPEQQIKKGTSGTARLIAKPLGISPLTVQNEASTILGGLGSQLLNASDTALNKLGAIPDNQVSAKGIGSALAKRFFQASGGNTKNQIESEVIKGFNPKETTAYQQVTTPNAVDENGNPILASSSLASPDRYATYLAYPKVFDAVKQIQLVNANHDPFWDWSPAQQKAYMYANVISKYDPGGDKTTVNALYSSIPQDLFDQRSQYFNSLTQSGQMAPQQQSPYTVQTPQAVTDFWNQYFKFPQGSGQRRAMLQSPLGQQALQLTQQKTNLTNQQRLDMGLPLLPATSGGSSGGSGGSGGSYSALSAYKMKQNLKRIARTKAPRMRVKGISSRGVRVPRLKTIARSPKMKEPRLSFKVPKQKFRGGAIV